MKHLGLFEGIGGFSLAGRWMGWETVAWCEWDTFCQRVLKHHFPAADRLGDITKTDFKEYYGLVDIITGGFPCQPFSVSGNRKGTDDHRALWPEMLRAIRESRPKWVVGENVAGITSMAQLCGTPEMEGSEDYTEMDSTFYQIINDLEKEGYTVQTFIIPACSVGAPHRRDRVWIVAHTSSPGVRNIAGSACDKGRTANADRAKSIRQGYRQACANWPFAANKVITNAEGKRGAALRIGNKAALPVNGEPCRAWAASNATGRRRFRRSDIKREGQTGRGRVKFDYSEINGNTNSARCEKRNAPEKPSFSGFGSGQPFGAWDKWPSQPPVCSRNDGVSTGLARITISRKRVHRTLTAAQATSKHRSESLKAYGNAIVPQVAYQLFKAIQAHDNQ